MNECTLYFYWMKIGRPSDDSNDDDDAELKMAMMIVILINVISVLLV